MSNFFILTGGPIMSPGNCLICGYSGADRLFLDPRKDFEFYGSVIICEPCIGAMAQDFGFLQPAQARNLELRVEEAERELDLLRSAIAQLESVRDLITQYGAGNSNLGLGTVVSSIDAADSGVLEPAVVPERPVTAKSGPRNSKADNDSGKPGSDDVSNPLLGDGFFSQSL